MPIIEGVGDEVTIFVTILFILTGLLLAWLTTTLTPGTSDTETLITEEATSEGNDAASDNAGNDTTETGAQQQEEPPETDADGEVRNQLYPELNRTDSPGAVGGDSVPQNSPSQNSEASASTPSANSESTSPSGPSERLDGHIRLKIKYLDERERYVQVRPDENIENFKR
jgi:preprotein translocase subunit SecG